MIKTLTISVLCLHLVACATGQAPVIDKSPNRVIPAEVVVTKGDSLYSISWQYGLDHQKIAKWNAIAKPYVIRPGQRLRLRPPTSSQAVVATRSKSPTTTQTATRTASQPKSATKPKSVTSQPTQSSLPTAAPGKWNWPAKGKLIGKFSRNSGQNGIRIAGADGSAIRSTAAGEVVYAGEGLRGYGKLIIVKHSSSYLSAYAHNRKILVAEGDQIKSGQQIAQMGSSGADRTMLHFEIRKDGKPVDPLKFLN